jgi:hypothetical protein
MMAKIMKDAEHGEGERRKWAKRIWDRDHHRVIHETGANANAVDLHRSREVLSVLQHRYPDSDLVLDKASASIHKVLVPEDQDDEGRVILMLVDRDGSTRLVGEESQILRYTPRRFQCARRLRGSYSGAKDHVLFESIGRANELPVRHPSLRSLL